MKILITSGRGFIGTYLATDLLEAGHHVTLYDRQPSAARPDTCILGDIRDSQTLAHATRGIDAVFHLAAEHRDDVRPSSLYYDVNVGGTQNLIQACTQNRIQRILFTSTVAVYGLNSCLPDETTPPNPFNDYGRSKLQAEAVLRQWASSDPNRSLTLIRPTVIFGEGSRGNIYNLLRQIVSGRFIMVGDARNQKSMAYVRNLTRFLTQMLETPPGLHLFNYADKQDFTMQDLIALVHQHISNGSGLPLRIPYPVGLLGGYAFDTLARLTGKTFPVSAIRIKKFCADTRINADKVKNTGFQAPYPLSEGLARMIQSEFNLSKPNANKNFLLGRIK